MSDVSGAFASDDENVISYKGENFYKACGALVTGEPGKGTTSCVKRVNHPGTDHEDYYGVVVSDAESKGAKLGEGGVATGSTESPA